MSGSPDPSSSRSRTDPLRADVRFYRPIGADSLKQWVAGRFLSVMAGRWTHCNLRVGDVVLDSSWAEGFFLVPAGEYPVIRPAIPRGPEIGRSILLR